MKEKKKFFDNNRLNKGYKKLSHSLQGNVSSDKKNYKNILPPIEMLEYYEELNPGTINKLLEMARKEQIHRQSIDLISIERNNKAIVFGRLAALLFIVIISITAFILTTYGNFFIASIFIFSAFSCIAIVSCASEKNILLSRFTRPKSLKSKH